LCGRYNIDDAEDIYEMREIMKEVYDRYQNTYELASMKTGEIFPTNVAPVIAAHDLNKAQEQKQTEKRTVRLMKWGFPRYGSTGVIINARAETALEKAMFRSSLLLRRCVIPSTGFFEWKKDTDSGKKVKCLIRYKDNPMLYMAGFFNTFTDKNGFPVNSYVILTAEANSTVSQIHDRMPVIISREKLDLWIFDDLAFSDILSQKPGDELSIDEFGNQ
jgi:putative SOS response-associated peptidase YedK